jgi:hypothetical protein
LPLVGVNLRRRLQDVLGSPLKMGASCALSGSVTSVIEYSLPVPIGKFRSVSAVTFVFPKYSCSWILCLFLRRFVSDSCGSRKLWIKMAPTSTARKERDWDKGTRRWSGVAQAWLWLFFPKYFCTSRTSRLLAFSSGVEPASGGAVKLRIKNAIVWGKERNKRKSWKPRCLGEILESLYRIQLEDSQVLQHISTPLAPNTASLSPFLHTNNNIDTTNSKSRILTELHYIQAIIRIRPAYRRL